MELNEKILELYDKYVEKTKTRDGIPLKYEEFKEQILSKAICKLAKEF